MTIFESGINYVRTQRAERKLYPTSTPPRNRCPVRLYSNDLGSQVAVTIVQIPKPSDRVVQEVEKYTQWLALVLRLCSARISAPRLPLLRLQDSLLRIAQCQNMGMLKMAKPADTSPWILCGGTLTVNFIWLETLVITTLDPGSQISHFERLFSLLYSISYYIQSFATIVSLERKNA